MESTGERIELYGGKTAEELAVLCDEEVEVLIAKECLRRGIPLVPVEPIEPEPPVPYDMTLFVVGDYAFTSEKAATEFLHTARRQNPVIVQSRGTHWNVRVVSEEPLFASYMRPRVEVLQAYSPQAYEQHKTLIERYSEDKALYDNAMQEYRNKYSKAIEQRKEIADEIWKAVRELRQEHESTLRMMDLFEQYVEISGDDVLKAKELFMQGHPDVPVRVSDYIEERIEEYQE